MSGEYQPIVRCAACDQDVIERELEDHWAKCRAKPAPEVRYFQYAVEGHPIEGRRFVEEVTPPEVIRAFYECGGLEDDPIVGTVHKKTCIRNNAKMAALAKKPADELTDTIAARSARYGDFKRQAEIGEAMRAAMRAAPNWERLNPYMRLALEWITDKISRILCGDPNYRDNWHDIAGYASLVDRELQGV